MSFQITYLLLITFSEPPAASRLSTDNQRKSTRSSMRQEIGSNTGLWAGASNAATRLQQVCLLLVSVPLVTDCLRGKRSHKYFSTWEARWEETWWKALKKRSPRWQIKLVWGNVKAPSAAGLNQSGLLPIKIKVLQRYVKLKIWVLRILFYFVFMALFLPG